MSSPRRCPKETNSAIKDRGAEPLAPRLLVHRHRVELQPVVDQLVAQPPRDLRLQALDLLGLELDDFAVARISSFLKSYGEMRKGEQFVMNEVRMRARERVRWIGSLVLLACAVLIAPVPWRRLWAGKKPLTPHA